MDENNDILRPTAEEEDLEAWNNLPHPQDELPTEVVRMYMIRDYRRMFNAFERYKNQADMNVRQIEARALAIASRRKLETQELTAMKLTVEDRERKINEMYDWMRQKEALIDSLRQHCTKQRDRIAVLERNLAAQRQQIQSLLNHIGGDGGKDALADCDASWNAERWKEAMVDIHAVRQQLGELAEAVRQQPLDGGAKDAILSAVKFIRHQTRRAYNFTASIASPVLRREFSVEIIPEDADEEDDITQ